ncbi:MAG TPA: Ig-like domain-containing protein [Gemmatimonadales bacterium]|nr:Ig-like domain-containing protein [Gemmatimonadales bacterium]
MTRAARFAGIAIAALAPLVLATCKDGEPTGVGRIARASVNLASLAGAATPGEADVPLDSIRVALTRVGDVAPALDTVIHARGDTVAGDSLVVRLQVQLRTDPENFNIVITTYGAGLTWYQASGTAVLSATTPAVPVLTAVYVGPGANAARVSVGPRDTVVVGGRTIGLRATVYDASNAPIAGVPVGYSLSNPTFGTVALPTYLTGTFTPSGTVRDSVWLIAQTPTHLRDSTRIHILPPPAQLLKASGDSQSVVTGAPILAPLTVRVLDALGGPFVGDTVTWTVTVGAAGLSGGTSVTDSAGYARVTVTPTVFGTVTVRASAGAIAGSPIAFTVRGTAGAAANIAIVSGNAQTDTVAHTLAQPLLVKVTDSLNNPVAGALVAFNQVFGPAGSPTADTGVTDGAGQRSLPFTLGTLVGIDSVRASIVGQASAVTFGIQAIAAKASVILADSGANQSGLAGLPLAQPFVVHVSDAYGNRITGATVNWTIRVGTGSLSAPTTPTDALGRARVTLTLPGAPGVDTVRAALQGTPAFAEFAASALSGVVAQVVLDRTVDTVALATQLKYHAVLKDSSGNTVSGPVTWTSSVPGVGSILSTTADSNTATALAGGVTSVIAAANGHADTALLYVRALSTIAVSPADTVITAVGDSVTLKAAALDNFGDTVTSGVVLKFTSATPTVLSVNPATGRAHLVGAGNGVVLVQDTVSKRQGTATLRVIQKVASIVNSPADSIQVGVSAQAQIVATAKDRNGYPIGGKTFGWRVRNTGIATINATGVVTGVALGQSYAVDSLVDSAAVFHDSTLVSVVAAPPAKLSWSFPSVAIGNGGNLQVGLSLTKLSITPVVIRIHSSDTTKVKPTQTLLTIPASTASGTITLNGLAATVNGPDTVIISDTLGIYAPDTMLVSVVSTVSFAQIGQFSRTQDFYANQNETYTAQVLLSDPAPPGGLGITFVYGKPGTSGVAPSPAIVPAGQLTAQVVFTGLAAGTDSVVPSSGGFVGKFSYVHVAPDSLHFQHQYPYNGVVGLRQTLPNPYVYFTYGMDHNLPLVATTTTGKVTTPAGDTVKANQTSAYIPVAGVGLGRDTVTISATGWVPVRAPFIVTTPHAGTGGTTSLVAGQPTAGTWYAYAEDSLLYQHAVMDTVTFTAVVRDTSVLVMDTSVARMLPGSSQRNVNGFHAKSTAGGDSTWIVVSAPGYTPDSFLVHVTKPILAIQLGYPYDGRIGINTAFTSAGYVYIPYARPDTFWVHFTHTRRGIVGGPDSVRILPNQTSSAYFNNEGDTLGVDTMTMVAPGYVVQGGNVANDGRVIWNVDPLHVTAYSYPSNLVTISPAQQFGVALRDSANGTYRNLLSPMQVSVTSSNPAALAVDSATITIAAGQYIRYDTLRVLGADTTNLLRLHVSGAGVGQDSSNVIRITATPLTIAVGYPYAFQPGFRLRQPSSYVYLPANAPDTVTVVLSHAVAGKDSLTRDTLVINKGTNSSGYFDMIGLDSTGVDTIFATAPGFVTAKAAVTPQAAWVHTPSIGTTHLTTDPAYRGYVYLTNRPNSVQQRPFLPETVTVVSSNPGVILIDSALSVNGTGDTARVRIDSSGSTSYYRVRFVGGGTAYLKTFAPTLSADSTPVVTVTGPSLYFGYTNVSLGVGQQFLQYVYVNNPVASDLWVHVAKSDSTLPPASQAFTLSADSIRIPAGQTSSPVYDTLVGNAIASSFLIARAPGYGQATTQVQVNAPRLAVSAPTLNLTVGAVPYNVSVYTQDQSANYRNVYAPLVLTDSSSDATVTAADSASRTIAAHLGSTTFGLTGFKKGSAQIVFRATGYAPDTVAVQVDTATLQIFGVPTGLGAGQTNGNAYVYLGFNTVAPVTVSLTSSDPATLTVPATVTVLAGQSSAYFQITGVAAGTATITASSPITHPSVPAGLRISTPKLVIGSLPASVTVGQKYTVYVYAQDSVGNYQNVVAPLAVTLTSSNPAFTTFDTTVVTIPAGAYYNFTGVTFTLGGGAPYTITATAPGYTAGVSGLVIAPAPPPPPGPVSRRP